MFCERDNVKKTSDLAARIVTYSLAATPHLGRIGQFSQILKSTVSGREGRKTSSALTM